MAENEVTPDSPLGDPDLILSQAAITKNAPVLKKAQPASGLVVLYAGGYKPYGSAKEEILDAETLKSWLPTSMDFLKTASRTTTGPILAAADANEFLNQLANYQGKINRLIIIGHGAYGGIGLAGILLHAQTTESLNEYTFQKPENLAIIKDKIRPKFTKDAVIDLVACQSAASPSFTKVMKNAFGVKVRGLKGAVWWILRWNKSTQQIIEKDRGLLYLTKKKDGTPAKIYSTASSLPFK